MGVFHRRPQPTHVGAWDDQGLADLQQIFDVIFGDAQFEPGNPQLPIDLSSDDEVENILAAKHGGTGLDTYTIGDLIVAIGTQELDQLPDVATGNVLLSGGIGAIPAYGKVGLTTHVSGVLPIANGGTNSTATPTAGGVAYGTGTAYAFTAAGTSGQVLTSAGAGTPTWADPGAVGHWSPLTNGDATNPELVFLDGDVIEVWISP